jgi:hypothetical protein
VQGPPGVLEFPTGPASLTFTFTPNLVVPLLTGSWRGVIVTPDQQILTTTVFDLSILGAPQAITIPAPAVIGTYEIVFLVESPISLLGSTLGTATVTNSVNGDSQTFLPITALTTEGAQVTFEYSYGPTIVN